MNKEWADLLFIITISDIEDWSNDAENTALITEINYALQIIQPENSYLKWYFTILLFFTVFLIVSRRDFF